MPDAEGILEARSPAEMGAQTTPTGSLNIKGADNLDWGVKNRLSKLIQPDGRCMFLPIDHGYFQGPTRKLERPAETIAPLIHMADGLFVTQGVLRAAIPADLKTPVILRVSGGTSVVGNDLANETLVTSIEDVIRANAVAVGISVFIGTDYEKQTLQNLADMVDLCGNYNIPVMAVTAVGKEMEKRTARYLALCCRICAEIGARVVKTYYAADDFEKVTNGCPVPVVMAGGPKVDTERQVFDFVYDGIQKGAIGVNLGRNIWQSPNPVAVMSSLHAIIHDNATPAQAEEIFLDIKND